MPRPAKSHELGPRSLNGYSVALAADRAAARPRFSRYDHDVFSRPPRTSRFGVRPFPRLGGPLQNQLVSVRAVSELDRAFRRSPTNPPRGSSAGVCTRALRAGVGRGPPASSGSRRWCASSPRVSPGRPWCTGRRRPCEHVHFHQLASASRGRFAGSKLDPHSVNRSRRSGTSPHFLPPAATVFPARRVDLYVGCRRPRQPPTVGGANVALSAIGQEGLSSSVEHRKVGSLLCCFCRCDPGVPRIVPAGAAQHERLQHQPLGLVRRPVPVVVGKSSRLRFGPSRVARVAVRDSSVAAVNSVLHLRDALPVSSPSSGSPISSPFGEVRGISF